MIVTIITNELSSDISLKIKLADAVVPKQYNLESVSNKYNHTYMSQLLYTLYRLTVDLISIYYSY